MLCMWWRPVLAALGMAFAAGGAVAARCQGMSVRDMISVTDFLTSYYGEAGAAIVSPDGKYAAAVTQAGDVARDAVVDELLVWRVREISRWLSTEPGALAPKPVFRVVVRSANRFQDGVVPTGLIRDARWASDSKGIFFRARKPGVRAFGLYRAALDGTTRLVSAPEQDIRSYGMQGEEVVYGAAVSTDKQRQKSAAEEDARPYVVGTGDTLYRLLFPGSWLGGDTDWVTLWRISHGRRVRIPLRSRKGEVSDDRHILSVSPGGEFAIMDLPVQYVPAVWNGYGRTNYPVWPHVGPVTLAARNMWVPHVFTLIRLQSGLMTSVVAAPDGFSRMFFNFWLPGERGGPVVSAGVSWAPSGTAVLLRNTFLSNDGGKSKKGGSWGVERPCLAVVDIETSRAECVESLGSGSQHSTVMRAQWEDSAPDAVLVVLRNGAHLEEVPFCIHRNSAPWLTPCTGARRSQRTEIKSSGSIRFWVTQSLNSPARIFAALPGVGRGRVLYDPNARLRKKCIGTARTVTVSIGRWGTVPMGLLLPVNYISGRRYPLVIQTHGYRPDEFLSAGISGAFAARAFASSGIAVLQMPMCPVTAKAGVAPGATASLEGTSDEISCNVAIFRAGIRYVVSRGLVDPGRVGIIGFSITGEYVLAALENDGTRFAAAELIDSSLNTYTQYVDAMGSDQGYIDVWDDAKMGGPPIGAGLAKWLVKSPGFSIYKIRAPMLIQANGREGMLAMWEPYAILYKLERPVDFVVIQSGTHPFSNPLQRLASEGMSVDWFRFWLQHERPADDAEYQRWSSLRKRSAF